MRIVFGIIAAVVAVRYDFTHDGEEVDGMTVWQNLVHDVFAHAASDNLEDINTLSAEMPSRLYKPLWSYCQQGFTLLININ